MNAPAPGGVEDLAIRADFAARQSLIEVTSDAGDVLQSFGALVDAAERLSTRMAHPSEGVEHSMAMGRLAEMTSSVVNQPWPGRTLEQLHVPAPKQLDRAANFLRRAGRSGPEQLSPADAQRVRQRVLHTVYLASHAVDVALREEVPAQMALGNRGVAAEVQTLRERVSTIEHVAGVAVNGRSAPADPPTPAMSRLSSAFAEWDINAHRALAQTPNNAILEAIAVTQALATRASNTLMGAAAEMGHLPRDAYLRRLGPALQETAQQWSSLRGELSPFASAWHRPPPELVDSSRNLRSAVRDVVLDRGALASPSTIGDRVDVARAAPVAQQSIGCGTDLALMTRDMVSSGQHLTGPAAVVNRRLRELTEPFRQEREPGAAMSARDMMLGREVPVPEAVRRPWIRAADRLVDQSLGALSAATSTRALSAHSPSLAIPTKEPPGRGQAERTPPTSSGRTGPSVSR